MIYIQPLPGKKGGKIYESINFAHIMLLSAGAISGAIGIDEFRIKIPRLDHINYLFNKSKSFRK